MAAAVNREDKRWRTKRPGKGKKGYVFNHETLGNVSRAKLLAGVEGSYPCSQLCGHADSDPNHSESRTSC
jgi:hypothetical protein